MTEHITYWLYPELRALEPQERARLLAKAREGEFDFIEIAGLAIALLLGVVATRYSVAGLSVMDRFFAVLMNFVVAVPLVLVLGGPFYLRRTKRRLRELLRDRR